MFFCLRPNVNIPEINKNNKAYIKNITHSTENTRKEGRKNDTCPISFGKDKTYLAQKILYYERMIHLFFNVEKKEKPKDERKFKDRIISGALAVASVFSLTPTHQAKGSEEAEIMTEVTNSSTYKSEEMIVYTKTTPPHFNIST